MSTKSNYVWVENKPSLMEMIARLKDHPEIAIDTESNSLYVYHERVCLIQFSIPEMDYLVDPLAVDVAPLDELFASSKYQKVFHAAEYDVLSLKRDHGFIFSNLFDTMIAARVLGWRRYGLGSILQEHFHVTLDKRWQRYNWGLRPLSHEALEYARLDSHYLLNLRALQLRELKARRRLEEAFQAFQRQENLEPTEKVFDPDRFWRVRGVRDLLPGEQGILRELFILRDAIASHLDLPPFKVMTDATLVRLAQFQPADRAQLERVKGLSQRMKKRYAKKLIHAIQKGCQSPPPRPRRHNGPRMSDMDVARYEALRVWRKDLAATRDVEPDVILSNHILMELAQQPPNDAHALAQMDCLNDWQRKTYGAALLQVLNSGAS